MANFEGYLIKAYDDNNNLVAFPNKYINEATYKTTPNQREEIKAYRDENSRNLHRVTAAGKKTNIEFETRPNLHLADKKKIQKFFTDNIYPNTQEKASESASQRRIKLKYWNDESNEYKTGVFYRTDIQFTIKKITSNDIIYDVMKIELVEY